MYKNSINHFRGIAIIFIVFAHCFVLADFKYETIIGNTILILTKGGTLFFVFISGFLFHFIFYKKFIFKDFLIQKTKHVLVPYLILSTIPIVFLVLTKCNIDNSSSNYFGVNCNDFSSYSIFRHYFVGIGKNFVGYWYIPFITIIFLMSNIFIAFIRLNPKFQILITVFFLIISTFMHRGLLTSNFYLFQNVIYYLPIYLLGILFSTQNEMLYLRLTGKEFYFLIIAVALALLQAYIGKLGNYQKLPLSYEGVDLMFFQKIFLCLFFMIFLNRFENYKPKILNLIAINSFGIFFLHGIIISVLTEIKRKLDFSFSGNSFLRYLLVGFLVFSVAFLIAIIIKKLFPKYSKYLVGS